MKQLLFISLYSIFCFSSKAQQTVFEQSDGTQTATYQQVIQWYKDLAKYPQIKVIESGSTDAGKPLHLVLVSNDKKFEPDAWHRQKKVVILINNGIHPGEPDGIDASMMLVRDKKSYAAAKCSPCFYSGI